MSLSCLVNSGLPSFLTKSRFLCTFLAFYWISWSISAASSSTTLSFVAFFTSVTSLFSLLLKRIFSFSVKIARSLTRHAIGLLILTLGDVVHLPQKLFFDLFVVLIKDQFFLMITTEHNLLANPWVSFFSCGDHVLQVFHALSFCIFPHLQHLLLCQSVLVYSSLHNQVRKASCILLLLHLFDRLLDCLGVWAFFAWVIWIWVGHSEGFFWLHSTFNQCF